MISVVIPSYNRRDCMVALLADVYRQRGTDFEVIVVDDASPDDSVEVIRREFPQVRLFVNEANGGPCVSRNRGILEANGEWIVGFDSDVTLPDPRLLARIAARFSASPGVDGLSLRILKPDGVSDDVERWCHPRPVATHGNREFLTSYFSGTAYAFRREAVLAAGLYPELLYMHHEEVELAWRILDCGGSILHVPDLSVLHHANPVSRRSQVEVFLMPRNQILLAASCLPVPRAFFYVLPRTAFQGLKAIARGHFPDFLKAMVSAWKLLPQVCERRKPLRSTTFTLLRTIKAGTADLSPPSAEVSSAGRSA
jgi:GT2 family glycosyltransferase